MKALLLTGLEAVINKLLRLDPETLKTCSKIEGKSVKVEVTDWNLSFFILPYQQGLQLLGEYHKQPDTVISGKLFGMAKMGMSGASTKALFSESITIRGDTRTGGALRDILRNLDIDWEEELSKVVGDTVAHPLAHHFKKAFAFGKRGLKSLGENVSEYLHYESQQLPTKQSVETFILKVGKLRDDVDRMEARIENLIRNKKEGA